jgi:hypothetical protein
VAESLGNARITPGPSGFDIRTFECPACDNVHQIVVALADLTSLKQTVGFPGNSKRRHKGG